MNLPRIAAVAIVPSVVLLGACSSGSSSSSSRKAATSEPITVLVTNDDGYGAPGIDAVVTELRTLAAVTVTVVAPATSTSGTGSARTPGAVTASDQRTASGYPAVAVNGFPVDSVEYALARVLKRKPALVVSGVNEGANFGPLAKVSGTVGAARGAAAEGIPAIAASQGLGDPTGYVSAAKIVAGWVSAHRSELAAGNAPVAALNLNVPTCKAGALRGVKQVPQASDLTGANTGAVECATSRNDPTTDVAAFADGFASVTSLRGDGQPTTSTTVWTSQ